MLISLNNPIFGIGPILDVLDYLLFGIGPILVVAIILGLYLFKRKKNNKSLLDTYGIISMILAIILPPAGIIVGLIGVQKAKSNRRDPKLSKIGWILSLILTLVGIITIGLLILLIAGIGHLNF